VAGVVVVVGMEGELVVEVAGVVVVGMEGELVVEVAAVVAVVAVVVVLGAE
jgi:hypothetical protein